MAFITAQELPNTNVLGDVTDAEMGGDKVCLCSLWVGMARIMAKESPQTNVLGV